MRTRALALSWVGLAAATGCAPDQSADDDPYYRDLERCGRESLDDLAGRNVDPTQNEGDGFVSFMESGYVDTFGSWQTLHLVECLSGKGLAIEVKKVGFEGATHANATVRDLLPRLTGQITLAKAADAARRRNYAVRREQATRSRSEFAACACELNYPSSTAAWPAGAKAQ